MMTHFCHDDVITKISENFTNSSKLSYYSAKKYIGRLFQYQLKIRKTCLTFPHYYVASTPCPNIRLIELLTYVQELERLQEANSTLQKF